MAAARLRVLRLPSGAVLEGQIVGALERTPGPGEGSVLDGLFVGREPGTGEVRAVDLATGRADATLSTLLAFRLDPAERRATTARTLSDHARGVPAAAVQAIAAALEPGTDVLAVLTDEGATPALDDALARLGAEPLADEAVTAATVADVADRVVGVVAGPDRPVTPVTPISRSTRGRGPEAT